MDKSHQKRIKPEKMFLELGEWLGGVNLPVEKTVNYGSFNSILLISLGQKRGTCELFWDKKRSVKVGFGIHFKPFFNNFFGPAILKEKIMDNSNFPIWFCVKGGVKFFISKSTYSF